MLFRSPPKFTSPYCYSPPSIQTTTDNNQRTVFANHNHFSSGVKNGNPEKGCTRSFLYEQKAKGECENLSEVDKTLINRNCISPDRPESFKSYTFSENLSFLKNNEKISFQNKDQETTTKISFNNHKNKEQDFNKDRNFKETFSRKNTTNSYFSPKSGTHDQRLHSQVLELQREVCDVQKKYEKIEQNYNFSTKDNLASDGFSKKAKSGEFLEHNNAWEIKNREVEKENTILREKIRELDDSSSKFFQKKSAFLGNNLSTTLENCSSTKSRVDTDISIIEDFSVNKKPENKQLEFSKKTKKDESELTKVSGLYEESRRELLKIMKEVDNIRRENTYLITKLRKTEESLEEEKKKARGVHFDLEEKEMRLESMRKNEMDVLQREMDEKQRGQELVNIIKKLEKQLEENNTKIIKMDLLENENKCLVLKNEKAEKVYILEKKEMENRINESIKSIEKQNEIISKHIQNDNQNNENILKIKLLQEKVELLTKDSNMKAEEITKMMDSKKTIEKELFKTKKVISEQLNEVEILNLRNKEEKEKYKEEKLQYKNQLQEEYENKITQINNEHQKYTENKINIMLEEYQKLISENELYKEQLISIKNKSKEFIELNENLLEKVSKLEMSLSHILDKVNEMHSKDEAILNDEDHISKELAKLTNHINSIQSNTHEEQILLLENKIQYLNQQLLLSEHKIELLNEQLTQHEQEITDVNDDDNHSSQQTVTLNKYEAMPEINNENEEPQPVNLRESKRSMRSEEMGDYIEIDKNALLYICDILSITPKEGELLKNIIDYLEDHFIPEVQNNYKEVLELFGVEVEREMKKETHNKLMSEIKDFRLSLTHVLEKVGSIEKRRESLEKENHGLNKHLLKYEGIHNKMETMVKEQNETIIKTQITNLNLSFFNKYPNL